ncbi:MAG: alpha/beta hydrolase [Bacteroidales bacterium]|nr:alpha/beta hydrolase [Bacteroidales bacterium]
MKKPFLLFVFIVAGCLLPQISSGKCSRTADTSGITGKWNGLLKTPGGSIKIVFHIRKDGSSIRGLMDSPYQGAYGIPADSVGLKDSSVTIEINRLMIHYNGILKKSGNIEGNIVQHGFSFPLALTQKEMKKPQEPSIPFPYISDSVRFKNNKEGFSLSGTLTLPYEKGKFPAVVLISGSGPQNRDEEIMGHKPFLVLSDFLTRNGIAVLRFDDRGVGRSEGNFASATTADFATDVESAVSFLRTRPEINKDHIGLIGHSEGGEIAPMVAAKDKDINFIILMSAPGIRGDKLLLLQEKLIATASGADPGAIKEQQKINGGAFDIILSAHCHDRISTAELDSIGRKLKAYFETDPQIAESEADSLKRDSYINQLAAGLDNPWMIYFIKHDPAIPLSKVKCPVLAIGGDRDLQVQPDVNMAMIGIALDEAGNKRVTLKNFPGLNHLLQKCNTGLPAEYAEIEQTLSPEVMNFITSWIKDILKKGK